MKLLTFPPPSYSAKLFEVNWENRVFKIAGTLDGFIDFATPESGTYPLSLDEAERLAKALGDAIADVRKNCMYESDALLEGKS